MSTLKLSLVGFGSRLALMGLIMVNALLLARFLGPQGFGEYFLFLRVISVLVVVADLGLSQSVNAFFGRHEQWRAHLHGVILRFVPAFSICASILGAIIVHFAGQTLLPNFPGQLAWMAFAAIPMVLYAQVWISMMTGMGRIWQLNLVQLVINTLSLVLTLIFIVGLSGGVLAAATVYMTAVSIQFLVMLVIALRVQRGESERAPADLSRQMLHFGLRGYLGTFSYIVWTRVPVFLLNAFHGPAAVGIFSVAQNLTERMLLPVQAVQDACYRRMSILSNRAATFSMNRYLRLTGWGMWAVVLLGVVLAPSVIVLLLGQKYAASAQVVRILLPGIAFMGASFLLDTYFLNQLRRPGLLSILAWINALVSLTLAFLLIPALAEKGAALALVLTQVLGTLLYFTLYLRISRTRLAQLFIIDNNDLTLIRDQVGTMLGWKGGRG